MKLSKKMLRELISEVVKERIDGAPQTYPSEEERMAQLRKQGLIPGAGEEAEYKTPRDPLEVIVTLKKEITRLQSMNLTLINQLSEYGVEPKIAHPGDPDTKVSLDTIRRKK